MDYSIAVCPQQYWDYKYNPFLINYNWFFLKKIIETGNEDQNWSNKKAHEKTPVLSARFQLYDHAIDRLIKK